MVCLQKLELVRTDQYVYTPYGTNLKRGGGTPGGVYCQMAICSNKGWGVGFKLDMGTDAGTAVFKNLKNDLSY